MNGQHKTLREQIASLAKAILAIALAMYLSAAAPWPICREAHASQASDMKNQIDEEYEELENIQAKIDETSDSMAEMTGETASLSNSIIALQEKIDGDRGELGRMLVTAYKTRNISPDSIYKIALSSESFADFMRQIQYYKASVDNIIMMISSMKEDSDNMTSQVASLIEDQKVLEEQFDSLSQLRDEQSVLIDNLEEKLSELQEEERLEQLESMKQKASSETVTYETDEGQDGWITVQASAYSIADNTPPGSTATASGIPLDESVPTVAMPVSINPARYYGRQIEISYNGTSVIATVTDCGYLSGGARGLDLTPAVYRAFGFYSLYDWGVRTVKYRFI